MGQACSHANCNRKCTRNDLCIEFARIPFADPIELRSIIADQPSEYVQAAGRTLWICFSECTWWERYSFQKWNNKNRPLVKHCGLFEVYLFDLEVPNLLLDS